MILSAQQYYVAATERMLQARKVQSLGGSYALAMYCGGLAVECLLRAFRWEQDKSFDGRHDLRLLLKTSGLLDAHLAHLKKKRRATAEEVEQADLELNAAVGELYVLWDNGLRYASEAKLREFLRERGRLLGVKGDPLKKNAADLLDAAQPIVDRGMAVWISKKK